MNLNIKPTQLIAVGLLGFVGYTLWKQSQTPVPPQQPNTLLPPKQANPAAYQKWVQWAATAITLAKTFFPAGRDAYNYLFGANGLFSNTPGLPADESHQFYQDADAASGGDLTDINNNMNGLRGVRRIGCACNQRF